MLFTCRHAIGIASGLHRSMCAIKIGLGPKAIWSSLAKWTGDVPATNRKEKWLTALGSFEEVWSCSVHCRWTG